MTMSNDCVVTVTIELGHQANFLKEPSPEGFTHDWTVFVRGYEGSRLEYFVEKVVFKLHKTFKSPVRVISEPPFRVTESGYAGFILPIEIHFKNKQTPRKIIFSYDLFLNAKDSPPINNVRYEKLKFQNPTPEFKAKLIKAGGTEQGAEPIPYDLFGSPIRSEKKALPKIPKEKDKEKIKKKKKSSPHTKSSPAQSLSSLSSTSSDEDDDGGYTAPLPPPPLKKEKEHFVKKESSSSSSQPKQESSVPSLSSSSSHKDKSKHRSSSSSSSHKERTSSDKDPVHKPHKHKEKDKEREKSSSHKDKDVTKKDRDSSSQKVAKESVDTRKERESSHSSSKISTSSTQHENKIVGQVLHKDKEKTLQSKEKDTSNLSSKEKSNISSKDREKISKEKHLSHKDISPLLNSEEKKNKEDTSNDKLSKDKDKHSKKSHKRHLESTVHEDDTEKKKLKRSSSVASTDDKPVKSKSSSGQEKSISKENREKESGNEVRDKKSTQPSEKSKHEKNRHSDKPRHSHLSGSKQKESSIKRSETSHKHDKESVNSFLHSNYINGPMLQPQLLLSPLKSNSEDEDSPAPSPAAVVKGKQKPSSNNSSPGSKSSAISSDDVNKLDHEILPETEGNKHIVSGLTDSDSDSEEDDLYVKSPQKELKSILNKQSQQVTRINKNSSHKLSRRLSHGDTHKKTDQAENSSKKADKASRYRKEEKREEEKSAKTKYMEESKMDYSDNEVNIEHPKNSGDQACNGLDILASNGVSIGELIAINEKIEKAQADCNQELLDKVIEVVGETDDFELNDVSLSFDICSVDKNVVLQIQAVLREY